MSSDPVLTMAANLPLITIAVPSLNHGQFLEDTLCSIFSQRLPVEVMLADGGSTDNTLTTIERWQEKLSWWRSSPDAGQAAAINEAISRGSAPYVCWLNADDTYLEQGLRTLVDYLETHPAAPAVYARSWHTTEDGQPIRMYWTTAFSEWLFAQRCFISQPATLIRRSIWEAVGGVDEHLHLAFDYDLWWKIHHQFGPPHYIPVLVATNRVHHTTKTNTYRRGHYLEAMAVVKKHYGRVPLKWYLAWPWAVWFKSKLNKQAELIV